MAAAVTDSPSGKVAALRLRAIEGRLDHLCALPHGRRTVGECLDGCQFELKGVLPPAAYDFYLCGPTAFMKSLYKGLLEWGGPQSRVYYEFFGPVSQLKEGPKGAEKQAAVSKGTGEFEVRFAKSGLTAKWDRSMESILALAEAQGLRPDFSCRTGICHTCMSRLVEGQVEYVTEPLDLPDPGCVLICVSQPKTDVVIEV